tara:strand:+ start:2936 stop:4009 length:1074 start_codon:yes stop_codon:yes gene_type:complete
MNKITCPHCNKTFDISESINNEIQELKKEEKSKVEKEVKADLEKKNNLERKEEKKALASELEKERNKSNIEKKEKDAKIQQLLKDKNENENKAREEATSIEEAKNKKLIEQLKKTHAQERAQDKLQHDRTKKDLKKVQERANQGLTADQGSAQEIILGDYLKEIFQSSNDKVSSYEKGEQGADWLHEVYEKNTLIGKILYESKNTKSYSSRWIDKLQQDMTQVHADVGIIFTIATPKELNEQQGYIQKGNIFICSYDFNALKFLAKTQRHSLQLLNKYNEDNKGDNKMSAFEFLSSAEVQNKMNSLQSKMLELGDLVGKQKKLTIKFEETHSDMDNYLDDFLDMTTIHGLISKKKKK